MSGANREGERIATAPPRAERGTERAQAFPGLFPPNAKPD